MEPLCGEYPSWVPCLSFEEEDCGSFFNMIIAIMDVVRKVFLGKSVYVTLEIEVESMELSYILILTMESYWKYIILFLFCSTWIW